MIDGSKVVVCFLEGESQTKTYVGTTEADINGTVNSGNRMCVIKSKDSGRKIVY